MPFSIVRNDITKMEVDAIVHTTNVYLKQGSGTSRAIFLAAGEEKLTAACEAIGRLILGQAVITDGFDLPAKYIIHASGPIWIDGNHKERQVLAQTYRSAMEVATEQGVQSIAFPLISSGNNGFPKQMALQIAISSIYEYLMSHDMQVYLVLYDRESWEMSRKIFSSVEQYIDDHYVRKNDESYPEHTVFVAYVNELLQPPYMEEKSEDITALLKQEEKNFAQTLFELIDRRGLKDSEVYNRANIDRRLFSKIRSDENYTPSKKTVLALAIALQLSLEETKDLLMKAGYALSNCNKRDLVIEYFIKNKNYNIHEINFVLEQYHQQILG